MKPKQAKSPRRTVRADGPDPIDIHVGQRLRLARSLAGINQTELGTGIGVSFQAVQKYEHGNNRISASRLFAAAQFLECSIGFFFEGIDDDSPESSTFLSKEMELVRALRRISHVDARDCILQLIRQIAVSHHGEDQDPKRQQAS